MESLRGGDKGSVAGALWRPEAKLRGLALLMRHQDEEATASSEESAGLAFIIEDVATELGQVREGLEPRFPDAAPRGRHGPTAPR